MLPLQINHALYLFVLLTDSLVYALLPSFDLCNLLLYHTNVFLKLNFDFKLFALKFEDFLLNFCLLLLNFCGQVANQLSHLVAFDSQG